MLPSKIVVIGAGSASFGLNTVGSLMRSARLRGSQIALVDRNARTLDLMKRLAERMNREWDAGMVITAHTHHDEALEGAGFVVSAIEVPPREVLWRQDYELTLKYGVRQPYAENGGPGRLCPRHPQRPAGAGDRPRHGAGLPRRLVPQLLQPDGAHL